MSEPAYKRARLQRPPSPVYKFDDEDDTYEPYVPVAQRRQAKLAKLTSWGANAEKEKARRLQEEQDERDDEEREEERLREKARKERTLLMEAQEVHDRKAAEGVCSFPSNYKPLLTMATKTRRRLQLKRQKRLMPRFLPLLPLAGNSHQIWSWRRVSSTQSP